MRFVRWLVWVLGWSLAAVLWAATDLTITNGKDSTSLSAAQLLARPDARALSVSADIAYDKSMQYQAVPLRTLLKESGFSAQDTVPFVALDGFVASLPARLLMADGDAAQAWLAVEPESDHWPALSGNAASAGPFYLVWINPQKSNIKQEQWPYQIARIERVDSLEARFPVLAPPASTPLSSKVWQGFEVYKTQCSVCHRVNGGGEGNVGPDLNQPMNPTRYLQADALKKLIRNPAQVRTWPTAKMPAFSEKTLGDNDLDALVAYLQAMAERH